jgi:hypothetical protein
MSFVHDMSLSARPSSHVVPPAGLRAMAMSFCLNNGGLSGRWVLEAVHPIGGGPSRARRRTRYPGYS